MALPNPVKQPLKPETQRPILIQGGKGRDVLEEQSIPQKLAITMGVFLLTFGLIGFVAPTFLSTHLSTAHNLLHLALGGLALFFGLFRDTPEALVFDWTAGSLFGAAGIFGFLFGSPGIPNNVGMPEMSTDQFAIVFAPSTLELGTGDHILNLVIASVFLIVSAVATQKENRKG